METPKFHETFKPILEILKHKNIITSRELIKSVALNFYSNLPAELLEQQTKSGENLLFNRIAWGKSYLKKGGYISFPERGRVQITDLGLASLSDISLNKVVDKSNFFTFYNTEEQSSLSSIGSTLRNEYGAPQLLDRFGIKLRSSY